MVYHLGPGLLRAVINYLGHTCGLLWAERGFIKWCSISENVIPTRRFSHSHSHSYAYLLSLETFMKECRSGPIHYIQDYDNAVRGLGLAALDVESCSYSDTYCLFLSSSPRHRYEPLVCAHSELARENSLLGSFVTLDGDLDIMTYMEGFCNQECKSPAKRTWILNNNIGGL